MSETIILHCQEYSRHPTASAIIDQATVTGIEMPGQSFMRGIDYSPHGPKEIQIPLEWDSDKAENLASFYQRHLTLEDEAAPGWNCHSLAAAVMGWEVAWDGNCLPCHTPAAPAPTHPMGLADQQTYSIYKRVDATWPMMKPRKLIHSVVGLPNPQFNISVWGFRKPLRVVSNWDTLQVYPGEIHRKLPPLPLVNRAAVILPGYSRTLLNGPRRHLGSSIQAPDNVGLAAPAFQQLDHI